MSLFLLLLLLLFLLFFFIVVVVVAVVVAVAVERTKDQQTLFNLPWAFRFEGAGRGAFSDRS